MRRLHHRQRIAGVGAVSVEEVLAVDEYAFTFSSEVFDAIAHHREVLIERRVQRSGDMLVVCFCDDAHHVGARLHERTGEGVGCGFKPGLTGGAECDERGTSEMELTLGAAEEFGVGRVCPRPASFNEGDA